MGLPLGTTEIAQTISSTPWWDIWGPELAGAVVGGAITAGVVVWLSGRVEERVGRRLIHHEQQMEASRARELERLRLEDRARLSVIAPVRAELHRLADEPSYRSGAAHSCARILAHPDTAYAPTEVVRAIRDWLAQVGVLDRAWESVRAALDAFPEQKDRDLVWITVVGEPQGVTGLLGGSDPVETAIRGEADVLGQGATFPMKFPDNKRHLLELVPRVNEQAISQVRASVSALRQALDSERSALAGATKAVDDTLAEPHPELAPAYRSPGSID